MNNSKLALDNVTLSIESLSVAEWGDTEPRLRQREEKLVKVLEAIEGIRLTTQWKLLREEVFDSLVETLERELREEAKKNSPDVLKLSRTAGKLTWAERYADLTKLADTFRVELTGLRKMLYDK